MTVFSQDIKNEIRIASNNAHKTQELQTLCRAAGINVTTFLPNGPPFISPPETGLTYIENAIIKARSACQQTKLPAIADDSGLEIDALGRKPGIYSARFAGQGAKYQDNIAKVLAELHQVSPAARTARFYCVVVYLSTAEDSAPIIAQGVWEGLIALEPKGVHNFGYDPIFWVPAHNCTAAELAPEVKNLISPRAQAIRSLALAFNKD